MANRPKGDAIITVNNEPRTIRLTLGAIAEIEDDLGVGLASLGDVMKGGNLKPVSMIIYWMLRAGGWEDLKKSEMLTLEMDLKEVMREFPKAMRKFSGQKEEETEEGK